MSNESAGELRDFGDSTYCLGSCRAIPALLFVRFGTTSGTLMPSMRSARVDLYELRRSVFSSTPELRPTALFRSNISFARSVTDDLLVDDVATELLRSGAL